MIGCAICGVGIGDRQPAHKAFSSFSEIPRPSLSIIAGVGSDTVLDNIDEDSVTTVGAGRPLPSETREGWLSDDGIDDW